MSRFLILFNAPEPMSEFMVRSTPEERQMGIDAWTKWKTEAEKTVGFEFGAVVQAFERIRENGELENSSSQVTNYAFVEASSRDVAVKALENHPHLQREGATIDVLEFLAMPS